MNRENPFTGSVFGMSLQSIEVMATTHPSMRAIVSAMKNAPALMEQRRKIVRDAEIEMRLRAKK